MSSSSFRLPSRARALSSLLLCTILLVTSASAATMASSQLSALLEVADQIPALKSLSTGAWTSSNLAASCNASNTALGVLSCNSTGFVTSLSITSGSGPAPESIANLTALTSLSLRYAMTGTLPSSWSSLVNLSSLSIENTQLIGGLPDAWTLMPRLSVLAVDFNETNAVVSSPPTWLSRLVSYRISNANWSGTSFPEWLVNSTVTNSVSLINCPTLTSSTTTAPSSSNATAPSSSPAPSSSAFPSSLLTNVILGAFTYTSAPSGSSTSFGSGASLPDFSGMTQLSSLTLGGLDFSGSLSSFTAAFLPSSLQILSLTDFPSLSGTIPQDLVDSTSLTSLSLGAMPKIFGDAAMPSNPAEATLATIHYDNLGLNGTIPQLALASSVVELSITKMAKLRGPFPEPFTATQVSSDSTLSCNVQSIVLSKNPAFGGSIPTTLVTQCSELETLVLDSSALTGSIPASFQSIASDVFSALSISGNPTSGTIPGIGPWKLNAQLSLVLSNASLTGSLPASLVSLNFTTFDLSQNKLDLCSTTASATKSYSSFFAASSSATCDLSYQTPQECGCTGTWPSACFEKRAMLSTCATTTPSVSPAPITPTTPTTPSSSTPNTGSSTPTASVPVATARNRIEPLAICYASEGTAHKYFFFAYRNTNNYAVNSSQVSSSALSPSGTIPSVFEVGTVYYAVFVDSINATSASWSLEGYTATVKTACDNSSSISLTLSFSSTVTNLANIISSVANLTGAPSSSVTAKSGMKRANDVTITVSPNSQVSTASASAAILNGYGSITDGTATASSANLDSTPTVSDAVSDVPSSSPSASPSAPTLDSGVVPYDTAYADPVYTPILEISWPELHVPHGLNDGEVSGIVIGSILAVIILVVFLVVFLTKTPKNPSFHSKNPSTTKDRRRYANQSVATEPAYEAPSLTTKTAGDDEESEDAEFAEKSSTSTTSSTDDSARGE